MDSRSFAILMVGFFLISHEVTFFCFEPWSIDKFDILFSIFFWIVILNFMLVVILELRNLSWGHQKLLKWYIGYLLQWGSIKKLLKKIGQTRTKEQ